MEKIKQPSVAGTFYTDNADELKNQIEQFAKDNKNIYKVATRAVIVPHAGLVYSGRLAYEGISQLDKKIKNIFIFAPSHRIGFDGLALSGYDFWETPLGKVEINQEINKQLIKDFDATIYDDAFTREHSIEIQLPIVQSIFDDVKIIPVLIGMTSAESIEKIINHFYNDEQNGFIISSDLSHFLKDEDAKKVDLITAGMIETNQIKNFNHQQACGATGIIGLINFASKNNFSLIRIDMTNSSSTTNDKSNVVGYGCWFLLEGDKNTFLKEHYSKFILELCKLSIKSRFIQNRIEISYPQVFDEQGACFVTLEKNDNLRGCIGSIIAHKPLIEDIILNAQNAAFKDPRFNPLQQEELDDLKISVSLLSAPTQIDFKDEKDLLDKIVPQKDGIIIKDGRYQAVYLPSVWEQLPDKNDFLNSLKIKAGLAPDYFSDTFEAYRFHTEYVQ